MSMNSRLQPTSGNLTGSVRSVSMLPLLSKDEDFTSLLPSYQEALGSLAEKNYLSGYLKKKNDLGPDKTPFIQRKWTDWYVELTGSSLMFWSVKTPADCELPRLETIKKRTPNFINIADCNVYTITDSIDGSKHTFVLNSAGANRFFFQTRSEEELNTWVLAIRLACMEISHLQEYYTGMLLRSNVHSPAQLQSFPSFGGFIEMRCCGNLNWHRYWMNIGHSAEGKPSITFSSSKYSTEYVYVVSNLQQAYAIFPGQVDLIDEANVFRLNGQVEVFNDQALNDTSPPYILVMAAAQQEMISALLTCYDNFNLYSRPSSLNFLPLPEQPSIYLDMSEVSNINVVHDTFQSTRQNLIEISNEKFGIKLASPLPLDAEPRAESPTKIVSNEETDEEIELEDNEFETEPQSTFPTMPLQHVPKSSSISSPLKSPLTSALSPKGRPKPRKSVSVTWQDDSSSDEKPPQIKGGEKDDDDDDDEEDFPKIKKNMPTRPTKKTETRKKVQLNSDESSDDDAPIKASQGLSTDFLADDISSKLTLNDPRLSIVENQNRPTSYMSSSAQPKSRLDARPMSVSRDPSSDNQTKLQPKGQAESKRKSKVVLPNGSDSSSEDDSMPIASNNNNIRHQHERVLSEGSSNQFQRSIPDDDDDDAPIGAGQMAVDPYNTPFNQNMMRASYYSQGPVEYGPDGMPYYPQDMNPNMGGYPSGVYDPNGYNQYNPALRQPSNLLEAQDYARYNDQMMMNQPRFGPLIQLPNKKETKPKGGLVGAISALEQQRAANRYTNSNARMTHQVNMQNGYNPELERERNFEQHKQRLLLEQRAQLSQSQIFSNDFNYANHGYPQQGPPQGMPYGNPLASQSAGSFYNPGPGGLLSPSASQGFLPQQDFNQLQHPDYRQSFYDPNGMGMGMHRSHSQTDLHHAQFQNNAYMDQGKMYSPPTSGRVPHGQGIPPHISSGGPSEGVASNEDLPLQDHVNKGDSDDDDKPVGLASKAVVNPMFAKGRYREHTVSQLKVKKLEDEDETESEPEIDDDVQDAFDEFVESCLVMRPYAYERPVKVHHAFLDWCREAEAAEGLDDSDLPDPNTFSHLMVQAGFVRKKRPSNSKLQQGEDPNEEWWYNIAIVE